MEKLVIEGGVPIKGEITLSGAKNSGFKLMIASLLSEEPSIIRDFPKIGDVETTKKIIEALGGRVEEEDFQLKVFPKNLCSWQIPFELGERSRACALFVGPLLFRFGKAVFPFPGGDRIGNRPLDRHFAGLTALGAEIKTRKGFFEISAPKGLSGTRYQFSQNTHTGTESILMAAAGAKGKTILENAAEEPEIDALISFLNKMGAKIKRVEKRKIEINGVKNFSGTVEEVIPDRNEVITFACAALITGGNVLVKRANPLVLTAFLKKVHQAGGDYEIEKKGIRFFGKGRLKATRVTTGIYPGFMSDWQPLWAVSMTQAQGISVIHEAVFENRFGYIPYLEEMGAKIKFFNPKITNSKDFYNFNWRENNAGDFHAVKIFGPSELRGTQMKVLDVRAGATLCLAALVAKEETKLSGIEQIDRGYDNLDGKLKSLGVRIKREI